jgi:hypothetical protein
MPDQPDSPPADRPPPAPHTREEPEGGTAVAVLLAVAAVLAAVIAGRASIVADRGSDTWHASVRQHVKQAAGIVETSRFVYGEEAANALAVVDARTYAEELREEARRYSGAVREAVLVEAFAQDQLAQTIAQSQPLATNPRYQGPGGVPNVVQRLADERASTPDLVVLAPDATEEEGAELNRKASFLIAAAVPVALAFLFGALVHGFPRGRRQLVVAGFAFVAIGLVAAVAVEVVV